MPTVPSYGGAPRVQESAGPQGLGQITARQDAEALGGGESFNKVTSAASKLYDKVKSDADQVAVLDADNKLARLETQLLYDPKTGAFAKKGKDAFGSVESVNSDFDKQISDIEASLSSPEQRAAFRQRYSQRKESVNRQLQQHVAGEITRYDDENTQASLANDKNLAVANPALNLPGALKRQEENIMSWASRKGLSAEVAKLKVEENASQTRMAVLQEFMAKGDDVTAKAFFDAHPDGFVGGDKIQALKMVEEGSTLGQAMRMADDSLQKGMGLSQMMAQAKEIENPKLRRAFEDRARDLDQQRKMAKSDFEEKTNIQAANFIDSGGNWQQYAQQNAGRWQQLTEAKREQIMSYRAGGAKVTDQKVWYTLRDLATNPETRGDFNRMDLTKYMNQLSGGDFQELAKLQQDSRNGKTQGLDGFQRDDEVVNSTLSAMGYSATQIKDKIKPEIVEFRMKADQAIIAYEQRTGKKPDNNELRKMLSSLSYEVTTQKGMFWDTKKKFYQLSDTEIDSLKPADIPKEYRAQIKDALRKKGLPDTEKNQLDLWVKKLRTDSGRKVSAN